MRRSLTCLLLLVATVPIGLAVRFLPWHLPWLLWKYLGSMLWAVALYWLIAACSPRSRPVIVGALASFAALLVKLSRLVPEPHIDAFRLTLAGRLLLGRIFSPWNIAAYLIAIALTAFADQCLHVGNQIDRRVTR